MGGNSLYMKVDDRQVIMMFNRLTGPEAKKAELIALRNSGNILKKKTDENFKSTGINMELRRKEQITKKNGKTVNKIRRIATVKVIKKDMIVKVHIMSDFRVKFFEKGTKKRHTKGYRYRNEEHVYRKGRRKYYKKDGKGRNTGSIKPRWFFRDAQSQTERKIFDNMDKELSKAIVKIANKKK